MFLHLSVSHSVQWGVCLNASWDTQLPWADTSSGSIGRVRGGPRNMKSMWPPSVAIFFMTYFHRAKWAMAPRPPWIRYWTTPWAHTPWAHTPWAHTPWAHTPWAHTPWAHTPWAHTPWAHTPLGTHTPLGMHPLPSACWDTHPPAQCMLGYTLPCPVHAGIHTPLPSACWDRHGYCCGQGSHISSNVSWKDGVIQFLIDIWWI